MLAGPWVSLGHLFLLGVWAVNCLAAWACAKLVLSLVRRAARS
jgi:hypothetical protein